MIQPRDALVLAYTKLRARRVRTVVTIGISGLLFAVLVAVLVTFQGAVNSVAAFNKNGLSSRYIVSADSFLQLGPNVFEDPMLIARAQQLYAQTVADKKVAAKKLGITYDPTTEPLPVQHLTGQRTVDILNFGSPAAQQAMLEYAQAHPNPGLSDLKRVSVAYHPITFYSSTQAVPNDGNINTMPDGKEKFPSATTAIQQEQADDIFTRNSFAFMPPQLTAPFLLSRTTWRPQSDAIPLLVPYSVATKLLGLPALPGGASADQKLQRIQELNAKAGTTVINACYRNSSSAEQIQTAVTTAADILQHSGDKHYTKPELIYGLPAGDSCGPAVITRDVRTKQQKQLDANQETFNEEFKVTTPPDQQKLAFQIVGLTPDQQNAPSNSAAGIVQGLVGSSLSGVIAIPTNMYDQLPSAQRYTHLLTPEPSAFAFNPTSYYVEFASAGEARNFIDEKSCTTGPSGQCSTAAKPFQLTAYGSNSIGLKDVQRKFNTFFAIAGLVVVGLAVVIMAGTVGRMLADSRRETAVFRAIGASRWDMAGVYGLYTILLSLMIVVASMAVGLLLARLADWHWWKATTVQAKLAFGGADTSQMFHFFGYTPRVWLVVAGIIAASLLGMVLPLLRNIRRNPIKDMRDE
ncbi:MAG TPA: ABC transporter permease [Candidatus Saccharimonadales bacterium]|nr:ABC transporter permease [Candidatus Saccharimonadales bacterium]